MHVYVTSSLLGLHVVHASSLEVLVPAFKYCGKLVGYNVGATCRFLSARAHVLLVGAHVLSVGARVLSVGAHVLSVGAHVLSVGVHVYLI